MEVGGAGEDLTRVLVVTVMVMEMVTGATTAVTRWIWVWVGVREDPKWALSARHPRI